jgi:hypothetical protein
MRWKGRHRRPQFRDCVECGDTFEVQPGKGLAKACSPECSHEWRKKSQRTYALNRYRADPEASKAQRRRAYAENPEPILAKNAAWEREHRPVVNAGKRALYADKKGAPVRPWCRQAEAADAD